MVLCPNNKLGYNDTVDPIPTNETLLMFFAIQDGRLCQQSISVSRMWSWVNQSRPFCFINKVNLTLYMNQTNQQLRYVIYARKSSENEDRQVQSIDDQVNRLKDLAKQQGFKVVQVLTEAKSAKRPDNRPVFQEVLDIIESGKADGILCWQINRLSRNPVDSGRLQMMLQDGIIKSIRTMDREYQPTDNVLLLSVESGMANQFILDLRKNTMRGLESKIAKGWLPARAPTGYLNDQLQKTIIKDPERFELVRKMWDLILTGNYNPTKIIDIANDEWGFRTAKRSKMGNKPLSHSCAYSIFNNKFYAGIICYDGKEYPGAHEPMISLDEFERVQQILGKTSKPRPQKHEFAFTGLIRCATCGCMVTAESKTKHVKATGKDATYTYYRCTRRKRDIQCHEPVIKLADLEDQISQEIEKFTIDPEFRDWALNVIKKNNDKEIEVRNKERSMVESSYNDTQKQFDNLTRMRYRDMIDDVTFERERDALQKQLNTLKLKMNESHDRAKNWIELTEQAFCFAANAKERFLTGDVRTKREILAAMGNHFELHQGMLKIQPVEWLIPISNNAKQINEDVKRLELIKKSSTYEKTPAIAEVYSRWGGQRELNP